MSFIKIAITAGALVSFASAASADFRYSGSPKLGEFYVQDSVRNARAEVLPNDTQAAPVAQPRKGGIAARGI